MRVLKPEEPGNYYYEDPDRRIVPPDLLDDLRKARVVVANYHQFQLRETVQLSKTSRQILGERGEPKQFTETEGQMIRRVAADLMGHKRIMVLNDEAHHCYRAKPGTSEEAAIGAEEREEAKSNSEAARVWISGIEAFQRHFEVPTVYDLSVTPFFLRGSGYGESSLSPHRVLPSDDDECMLDAVRDEDGTLPRRVLLKHETSFEHVVIEQLKVAGFANRKKGENVKFEGSPEPWPGQGWVSYAGRYLEGGAVRRAAIAIGPEYGTVGYEFVRAAGREAMDAFDVLLVCGFSFAPEVDETRLNFGRLRVVKLRMDQDVRQGMSDKLKKVKADSLFIVYGEPEIAVRELKGGLIEVEIKGVDIFDPSTGQVRSSASPEEDIAAWFVDDEYDAESFFVRQAYFLDGRQSDPYAALKRALNAEIDEEAWGQLRSTVTRPFPRPKSGRICVKVINHYGDEVQKVFRV